MKNKRNAEVKDGQALKKKGFKNRTARLAREIRQRKKQIIMVLPYVFIALLATNLGEAWRMASGKDASEKMISFMVTLSTAFRNPLPSLHPADLLTGACVGGCLRIFVFVKARDAKKFRKNYEYGSARWGTREEIEPFMDPDPMKNMILTKTEGLTMEGRPKIPANARNKNVLVVGSSGSGKTRFFIKPNLLQMHSSYVVTDPKTEKNEILDLNSTFQARFA